MPRNRKHLDRLVRLATAYDADLPDGDEVTFTLPEDLTGLADEDLAQLREDAVAAFDALYEQEVPSAEDVEAMNSLADATDAIRGEETRRADERDANRAAAEELASRVRPVEDDATDSSEDGDSDSEPTGETDDVEGEGEGSVTALESPAVDDGAEADTRDAVAASSQPRGPISVTLSGIRRRQGQPAPRTDDSNGGVSLVASSDLGGSFSSGDRISIADAAAALSRKAQGINESAYRQAFKSGRRLTQTLSIAAMPKEIPSELVAGSDNGMEVLARAVDETRLPGGSLVASGGWCSPSETLYDLFGALESNDGLISLPEVGVSRGGIRHTPGPDFSTLFSETGFTFTEAMDEDGEYALDGQGDPTEGPKPCFKVPCEDFVDDRLQVNGVCITAGILQNRSYPELTERTIEGSLVAHQHRIAGQIIGDMTGGSTAVAMPADQVGAYAPLLTAIELQAEHYKYVHRMGRAASLEVVLPYWVRGALRSDLSRRLGVPVENITNAVLGQHFAERMIAPQFVYNYQDLTGGAGAFTAWPSEVKFMMYAAGTWIRGSSDLITLEAVFDSALFTVNDFTALFTEEGWLVAKRGHDSREVTVPICANGATAGGVLIDCDGSEGTEADETV